MTTKIAVAAVLAVVSLLALFLTRPHPHTPGPPQHSPAQPGTPTPQHPTPAAVTAEQATRLLPHTPTQLAHAAALATRFAAAYATYRHDEPPRAYTNRLTPMATTQLQPLLARAATDPTVVNQRTHEHATSTGTATPQTIRTLGPTSITFIVTATEHLTTDHGPRTETTRYAITTTYSSDPDSKTNGQGEWQVDAIELATTGDTGDQPISPSQPTRAGSPLGDTP